MRSRMNTDEKTADERLLKQCSNSNLSSLSNCLCSYSFAGLFAAHLQRFLIPAVAFLCYCIGAERNRRIKVAQVTSECARRIGDERAELLFGRITSLVAKQISHQ